MRFTADDTLQSLLGRLGGGRDKTAMAQIGQTIHRTLSYAELDQQSAALAAGLLSRGLKRGDHVLLLAPNSPDWLTACVALLRAGLVPVPVDSQTAAEDLEHIVRDCRAGWAFTNASGAARIRSLEVAGDVTIVRLDDDGGDGEAGWRELATGSDGAAAAVGAGDTAIIFYTSGTSGPPKGVPLTHRNIVSNLDALLSLEIVHENDCVLLPLPLHHVYPLVVGLMTPLLMGMTVVVPSSLVGQNFFAALGQGKPSILLGVPRLHEALCTAIEQRFNAKGRAVGALFGGLLRFAIACREKLHLPIGVPLFWIVRRGVGPRLRMIISGGSALDPGITAKLEGLGFGVAWGYGLTETSPILTFRSADMRGADHIGRPLPGVEIRIAEPEAQFEFGELQAQGPNVFAGYLNLPDKTEAAFTSDGWFRTGDLGSVDSSGHIRLRGRATSMIVMPGGENVDPEKVERQLERSAAIREIGVLEHDGQLAGVAVPAPELLRDVSGDDVEQRLRSEVARLSRDLPSYQRPNRVVIDLSPLPRTRLGKLRRRELAARFLELAEHKPADGATASFDRAKLSPLDRELLEDRVASLVWDWLAEKFDGQVLTPDTHLQIDLGIDSLEWLNLTLEIRNRAGIELTDEAIARIETVRDLLQEAAGSKQAAGLSGDVVALLKEPDAMLSDEERGWLEPRSGLLGMLDPVAVAAARLVMRLFFRFRASGLENLPAASPYVIAPNHLSSLDPIAVVAALGLARFRETFWGGWVGILFRTRLSSALSHAMRILPVEPRAGPLSNLALAGGVLCRRKNLVWFPEGARSLSGTLQRFRPGIGLLLLANDDVPVVPVWIEGTGAALPPGRLWPRMAAVTMRFGPPCSVPELEAEGSGESREEKIANALQARVAALQDAGTVD
jgi:long-chain acyl-CoA synthetase